MLGGKAGGWGGHGREYWEGTAPLISLHSEFPPGDLEQSLHGGKPYQCPEPREPVTEAIERPHQHASAVASFQLWQMRMARVAGKRNRAVISSWLLCP
jgi:hypothetical protein